MWSNTVTEQQIMEDVPCSTHMAVDTTCEPVTSQCNAHLFSDHSNRIICLQVMKFVNTEDLYNACTRGVDLDSPCRVGDLARQAYIVRTINDFVL